MGMMLAAAGALGGLGKAVSGVGEEATARLGKEELMQKENDLATQRQTALERLRAQHESEMQQAGFKHEEASELQKQKFEHGETEFRVNAASRAAAAARDFDRWKTSAQIDERRYASDNSYAARVDSAYLRAVNTAKTGTGKNNMASQYKEHTIPDASGAGRLVLESPHGTYELLGDNYVPYNGQSAPPDISDRARASARDRDYLIQHLRDYPGAIVPKGLKGAGLTYDQAFERQWGIIPKPAMDILRSQEQQQGGQTSSSQTQSLQLPSGRVMSVPGGISLRGGGSEPPETPEAGESDDSSDGGTSMSTYNSVAGS